MLEHWQRTMVTGSGENITAAEDVLHRRGEDPMVMAFRRNNALAACSRVTTETWTAFQTAVHEEKRRSRKDIPRDDRQGEEFEW